MILTLVYDSNHDSFTCRKDGHLFVLSKKVDKATLNRDFILPMCNDYMIVSRLGHHPKGWLVEPIEHDHLLVEHDGFAKWPDTNRTTAWASKHNVTITPGRLHRTIRAIDLTRVVRNGDYELKNPDGTDAPSKVPGLCYVNGRPTGKNAARRDSQGGWLTTLLGVPTLDDLINVPTVS